MSRPLHVLLLQALGGAQSTLCLYVYVWGGGIETGWPHLNSQCRLRSRCGC